MVRLESGAPSLLPTGSVDGTIERRKVLGGLVGKRLISFVFGWTSEKTVCIKKANQV